MKHEIIMLLVLSPFALVASELSNQYPIVLLPGLLCQDRNGFDGKYFIWGLSQGDLQEQLIKENFRVMTAAGGAISSSYDRSVEIYTQLVGGTVDYGIAHSNKYGHARYGETYKTALYPEISSVNKVHLVGHSFGSIDCRVLTHLLNYGSEEEIAATPDSELNNLFKGGNDWIASCTMLSGPHDGSTFALSLKNNLPQLQQLMLAAAAVLGLESENHLYDFKLQQWGLTRYEGESLKDYSSRVFASNAWRTTTDNALVDLTPHGAAKINDWVKVVPHVNYFTFNTMATKPSLLRKDIYVPTSAMTQTLWAPALVMGAYSGVDREYGVIELDASYRPNDGQGNLRSMFAPSIGQNPLRDVPEIVRVVEGQETEILPGKFYNMPTLDGWDHYAIIGGGKVPVLPFYKSLATMLAEIPQRDESGVQAPFRISVTPCASLMAPSTAAIQSYGLAVLGTNPPHSKEVVDRLCSEAGLGGEDCQRMKQELLEM